MKGEWQAELTALRDDLTHRRRLMATALKSKQEEEALKVRAAFWVSWFGAGVVQSLFCFTGCLGRGGD